MTPTRIAIVVAALAVVGGGAYYLLKGPCSCCDGKSGAGGEGGAAGGGGAQDRKIGFEDRAKAAGIDFVMKFLPKEQGEHFKTNLYDHGCGVAAGDYDGDGRDDIFFCNQLGPNALYHNDGNGRFTDVTRKAGVLLEGRISVAAVFADYDNDGRQDLYVTTTRAGNALFHNRGDGTFENVTAKAGLTLVRHSQSPTFFDADGDGDLDLLVANTAKWTSDVMEQDGKYYVGPEGIFDLVASPKEDNTFYRNRGDGTFEEATKEAGLLGVGWGGDAAVFDCDDDGDMDVFLANMFGRSLLYVNDGKGHFHDGTREILGETSWGTVASKVFDYDGDGRLDLLLIDMHSDMWMLPEFPLRDIPPTKKFAFPYGPVVERGLATQDEVDKGYAKVPYKIDGVVFGNTLFHNLGGGKWEETSDKAGLETLWPWGIATGDFDCDGYEDVYLPSGMGWPFEFLPSPLLMNNGNGTFTNRAKEAGLDPLPGGNFLAITYGAKKSTRSSRSASCADFDGDGRMDIVVQNYNDVPFLLMNRWPKRSYVAFHLTGTKSNRDAIGATVKLTVGSRTMIRQVHAAGGYLADSSKTLHFGLGDAKKIDRCEVHWPSGAVQTLTDVAVNALHEVKEP